MGPLFFSSCLFFIFFFHFRFLFNFFPCFSFFFPLFFLFHFLFFYFPFVFLFKRNVSSFSFLFLFSFLGCSKSVAALQDSLGESAHSQLAFFCFVLAHRHFSLWNSAHPGDDQVESRIWWAAGGSSPTFAPESPD